MGRKQRFAMVEEIAAEYKNTYREAICQFRVQFGEDSAESLLGEFVQAIDVILNDLDTCIAQRNAVSVRRLTHRVIGLCPMYKAKPTAELSQLMEDELPQQNWAAIDLYNKQLRQSFVDYMRYT